MARPAEADLHHECGRKVCYWTRAKARHAQRQVRAKFGDRLRAYRCRFCRGWHLGRVRA